MRQLGLRDSYTADIAQDVPFSIFPGVNREFCVADGNGVVLTINGVEHRCTPGSITRFRGDDEVYATLIDGPMRALNLMVRDGAVEKHLQVVRAGGSIDLQNSNAVVAITGACPLSTSDAAADLTCLAHRACRTPSPIIYHGNSALSKYIP